MFFFGTVSVRHNSKTVNQSGEIMESLIKDVNYKQITNGSIFIKKYTVILFYNKSCVGSYLTELSLNEIIDEYSDIFSFYKINQDENEELSIKYKLPEKTVLLFYKYQTLIDLIPGIISKEEIKKTLNSLLENNY